MELERGDQVRDGAVEKTYLALLKGRWSLGKKRIDAPLKTNIRQGGERMVKVDVAGKDAASKPRVALDIVSRLKMDGIIGTAVAEALGVLGLSKGSVAAVRAGLGGWQAPWKSRAKPGPKEGEAATDGGDDDASDATRDLEDPAAKKEDPDAKTEDPAPKAPAAPKMPDGAALQKIADSLLGLMERPVPARLTVVREQLGAALSPLVPEWPAINKELVALEMKLMHQA